MNSRRNAPKLQLLVFIHPNNASAVLQEDRGWTKDEAMGEGYSWDLQSAVEPAEITEQLAKVFEVDLVEIYISTDELLELKRIFHSQNKSSGEWMLVYALSECERNPSIGETKWCVGFIEDMIDFAVSVLGHNATVRTTENINGSNQNVMIGIGLWWSPVVVGIGLGWSSAHWDDSSPKVVKSVVGDSINLVLEDGEIAAENITPFLIHDPVSDVGMFDKGFWNLSEVGFLNQANMEMV
ncbi:hypothetical protein RHMOL_Rhmol08G0234400 [Rhododendron molle]|uniref:Uncharacterized protein n=1 Tax=Rhododendron molle TaxID=49168 RepID=A0ACC0MRT0_RHOML|nr:hypothetical protein RHMOL_Rhmol08G0234400 [Rhododendron molle]